MSARLVDCPNGHRVRPRRVLFGLPTPELLESARRTASVTLGGCDPTFGPEFVCPTRGVPLEAVREQSRISDKSPKDHFRRALGLDHSLGMIEALLGPLSEDEKDHVVAGLLNDPANDKPVGKVGLTRAAIMSARREWLDEGPRSMAIYRRLGASKSTLMRSRHKLGLVPWPED